MKKIYETYSEQETKEIAYNLAKQSKKGSVYCLNGDLGVGKTIFTKGFAEGLKIEDHITSPTFTILNEYYDGIYPFYHFDVYRISDIMEMDEMGYEDYFYGEGICLIEWASLIEDIIPSDAILINIEKDLDKGFDYRKITIYNA